METREQRVGDFTFTVDFAGPISGDPVLLLHGFPETRHMWRPLLETLGGAGFRAIAPDQRGYSAGARPLETEAYAVEHLLGDALGLMDALGASSFHLVGHDWGGQLAWLLAAHHGGRLRSLSVLSRPHPAAFAKAMKDDPAQAERSRHHRTFQADDAIHRMRAAELAPLRQALKTQGVPEASVAIYAETLMQRGGIEGAMNWYRAGSGLQAADTPTVTVPTLYVWGQEDATVGSRAAALTADYVNAPCVFQPVEGGTHFVVDQFPQRMAELVLNHIREAGPAMA